jgi:nucleoside 2-deoxyribosyltransferase
MTPRVAVLVYCAGPLYSEAEKQFTQRPTRSLEDTGFSVLLPQREGSDVAPCSTSTNPRT